MNFILPDNQPILGGDCEVAAEATLRCAFDRRESRGAHQRGDYPDLDPSLGIDFTIS